MYEYLYGERDIQETYEWVNKGNSSRQSNNN